MENKWLKIWNSIGGRHTGCVVSQHGVCCGTSSLPADILEMTGGGCMPVVSFIGSLYPVDISVSGTD